MAPAGPRRCARRRRRPDPHGVVRMSTTDREVEEVSLVAALPGLARIGAVASIRLLEWTAGAYVRAGSRLVRAAVNGESAGQVLSRTGEDLLAYFRDLLGGTDDSAGPAAPRPAAPRRPRGRRPRRGRVRRPSPRCPRTTSPTLRSSRTSARRRRRCA